MATLQGSTWDLWSSQQNHGVLLNLDVADDNHFSTSSDKTAPYIQHLFCLLHRSVTLLSHGRNGCSSLEATGTPQFTSPQSLYKEPEWRLLKGWAIVSVQSSELPPALGSLNWLVGLPLCPDPFPKTICALNPPQLNFPFPCYSLLSVLE